MVPAVTAALCANTAGSQTMWLEPQRPTEKPIFPRHIMGLIGHI